MKNTMAINIVAYIPHTPTLTLGMDACIAVLFVHIRSGRFVYYYYYCTPLLWVSVRRESKTHATIKSACKFINTNEKFNENA